MTLKELLKLNQSDQKGVLNLSRRDLTALPAEIGKLTDLRELNLYGNQLTALPPQIGKLKNLTKLNVERNQLTALPAEIGKLTHLREFGIGGNQLTALPTEIGKLTDLTELNLSQNQLTALPPQIGNLTILTELYLANNQLTALPPEIGKLTNLTELYLGGNQLTALPPEIGELTDLTKLRLAANKLTALPPRIGELTNLRMLDLRNNKLTSLPPEIGKLTNLTELDVSGNELTAAPAELGKLTKLRTLSLWRNELAALPPEIGEMRDLRTLKLNGNKLTALPPEICRLTNLTLLHGSYNRLTALPPHIGKLTDLTDLDLSHNQLTDLPPQIGNLTNLTDLPLQGNGLTVLPPQIGKLTGLTELYLHKNKLTVLPPQIGNLTNLREIRLRRNQLTALPPEIGNLTQLKTLVLGENPLTSPPPEIIGQGTQAILTFLRERLEEGDEPQWVSKMLFMGEGGAGKTCLMGRLLNEGFDEREGTTRGIDIVPMKLTHPTEPDVEMILNTWDFGGQQIYHATHQFFLSNRSLFVLIWNACLGWEQGKLRHWLEQIRARAPQSPVLVVGTHIDEREAVLPSVDLACEYPQIVGFHGVSSKTGQGIEEFRAVLTRVAADLPLMGETWPANWVRAAEVIRAKKGEVESHIAPAELDRILEANDVHGNARGVLTQWLHDLGDILFFRDNPDLNDKIFLDPEWVTDRIYRVLDSKDIPEGTGFFERKHMKKLWPDLPKGMRDHLLRLMEQFDLSYRTLANNKEISIVVERLSLDPADYEPRWDAILGEEGCKEVAMRFQLNTIPAGIPTWFIARSHRFTTRTHWRNGALLCSGSHLAMIQAFGGESRNYVTLAARGPSPHNFFATLRDGFELTLGRFPGLEVRRLIPCPGHEGESCTHLFDLADVQNAYAKHRTDAQLQCPKTLDMIHVSTLLFGLDPTTQDDVIKLLHGLHTDHEAQSAQHVEMTTVEQEHFELLQVQVQELNTQVQRNFLFTYNKAQASIDSACPRVFSLVPADTGAWRKRLIGQNVTLHLWCEEPGAWHPVEGANYTFTLSAKWLRVVAPWVRVLVKVLKYAAPLAGPAASIVSSAVDEALKDHIKMAEELIKKLPDISDDPAESRAESLGASDEPGRARGANFRALRDLLTKLDPSQRWGGLQKVITPEGHYYWVCPEHAKQAKYTLMAAPQIP